MRTDDFSGVESGLRVEDASSDKDMSGTRERHIGLYRWHYVGTFQVPVARMTPTRLQRVNRSDSSGDFNGLSQVRTLETRLTPSTKS
jgi:hypothetical protein